MKPVRGRDEKRRYGNCSISEVAPVFVGKGALFYVFEIRGFRNGIFLQFASPRVRQRRGRWSPPTVVPAGPARRLRRRSTPPGIPPPPPGVILPTLLLTVRSMDGSDPFLIRLCGMSSGRGRGRRLYSCFIDGIGLMDWIDGIFNDRLIFTPSGSVDDRPRH